MDTSQTSSSQPRSSSGSARTHGSKSNNPDKQISQIEKSVTHLLVATKQLLETLTQWSRGNAQEEEVSDVYVRLGYEFNLACRAFNSIGVDTADLGPVPDLLRSILEDTLSQPASPQALDNYLPRIRDIIINLLHGLKRKQSKLRTKSSKDAGGKDTGTRSLAGPPRQSSVGSINSNETGLTSMMETVPSQTPGLRSDARQDQNLSSDNDRWTSSTTSNNTLQDRASTRRATEDTTPQTPIPQSVHSASTIPQQNLSTIIHDEPKEYTSIPGQPSAQRISSPPVKQDALSALQRGGDLERRASRRFSAYQIQKHLGGTPNGVPVIPPAQNSPIPNRGREVRESMTAVRSRASNQSTRQRSATKLTEATSTGSLGSRGADRISEEPDEAEVVLKSESVVVDQLTDGFGIDSPNVKTPEEFEGPPKILAAANDIPLHATNHETAQSVQPELLSQKKYEPTVKQEFSDQGRDVTLQAGETIAKPLVRTPDRAGFADNVDSSPPQTKELTLFLQHKSKIKKFVLSDGYDEVTMARLQLAFIEKFNWHTHNHDMELPEIYIQDPVSGVRHELEDLSDVKDRSVLVLNVEVLDEVKKHFDEGIGGLKSTLEGVRALIDGQASMMQRFGDRQLESAKEMARLSAVPAPRASQAAGATPSNGIVTRPESSMIEVQNLRRDIAVLRQTYSTMSADFAATMKDIKLKAEDVKTIAQQAAVPSYEGDAGRTHINAGKRTLSTESELLVNRVDDLSDAVEDLRKDVVIRGVRPLPRQLEELSKEISSTARDLTKMKEFMKREKPIWTKIWESELKTVCTERDDLTQQEELMADLDGDLEDVTGVFKLVEEAMKQQNLHGGGQGSLRGSSKQVEFDTSGVNIQTAKDGVLGEVRALQPNHETRLEAIERAERIRQKELESRKGGEFQREVANFVEEGKLKKTGGMEEVERLRKVKDEKARKENFEREAQRKIERERKRAEEAAAAAATAAAEKERQVAEADNELSEHTEAIAGAPPEVPLGDDTPFEDAPETSLTSTMLSTTDNDEPHIPDSANEPTSRLTPSPIKFEESSKRSSLVDATRGVESINTHPEPGPTTTATPDRGSWWKPALFANP